jgi:hypothetical protein
MKIHGGFDCIDWTYGTTRRAVVRAPTSPALTILPSRPGVLVEDVEFDAPDARRASAGSSIGALIDVSSNVVLRRTRIVAGKGGEGTGGANGAKKVMTPLRSPRGSRGARRALSRVGCSAVGRCSATGVDVRFARWGRGTATHGGDRPAGVPGNPRANVVPPDVDNGGSKA